jgi:ABC-type oligopeptide transport system ATPase subunit
MTNLSVRDLTKTYGQGGLAVDAVRHVDLDVEASEVVLIMGPSGSGKTTLLLMLGAMLRPTTGTITVARTLPAAVAGAALRLRVPGLQPALRPGRRWRTSSWPATWSASTAAPPASGPPTS